MEELERLRRDPSITILPADKGSKWTIMPTAKYLAEARRQLSNRSHYMETMEDIDEVTKGRLTSLLKQLLATGFISRKEFRALLPPPNYQPRRFYLLPKIHKEVWPDPEMPPGRPIVSDVRSVSRPCASFIEHFLAPIAQSAPSYLRDSQHLLALLQDSTLDEQSMFFTMDVANLYTNIPIEEGLQAVSQAFFEHKDRRRPDLTLLSMLRLLLTHNSFEFNGSSFLQLRGTPMGGAYSGSLANIYMAAWEKKLRSHPLQPRRWVRYIDDVFGIWDHGEQSLQDFHQFLNNIDSNISLDLQCNQDSIRFLDLELYRSGSSIGYRIGFKPTDSHSLLPPSSFHPSHVPRGILFSQVLRWATKSSSPEDFLATKRLVVPFWRRSGYTRTAIRSAIRRVFTRTGQSLEAWSPGFFPCVPSCRFCHYGVASRRVEDHLSNNAYAIQHRLCCSDTNIIYCITCKSCSKRYVGQTSRPLRRRISEHLNSIRAKRSTPVSEHFQTCGLSAFTFFALERVPQEQQRLVKEIAWMERLHTIVPHGLNTQDNRPDRDVIVLPHSMCADATHGVCRSLTGLRLVAAKRRSPNLKTLLAPSSCFLSAEEAE